MTPFDDDIISCLRVLQHGGTILYPTDTVWGLGCDATNREAVDKIFRIKQREASKSLIVLLADLRDINRYTAQPRPEALAYLENADRPTTVVYEGALGLAENLVAGDGSVAIRVVRDDFCRHLIRRLRRPLVSTSANFAGQPAPSVFSEVDPAVSGSVDYVVRYRRDDPVRRAPSALIRFGKDGQPVVLRP